MKVHVNAEVWKEGFEYLNIGYRSLSVDMNLFVWHMFEAELLTRPVPTEQLNAVVG